MNLRNEMGSEQIKKFKAEDDMLTSVAKWLNTQGYDIDLNDQLWMEDYVQDHRFRDLCHLLHDYHEAMSKPEPVPAECPPHQWANAAGNLVCLKCGVIDAD